MDSIVFNKVNDVAQDIIFCIDKLKINQPREDYKEILNLTIIFFGGALHGGINTRYPGAFHHVRWMVKVIYCLKIFIFRGEFFLTTDKINEIHDLCIFFVWFYIIFWFSVTSAILKTSRRDIECIKKSI